MGSYLALSASTPAPSTISDTNIAQDSDHTSPIATSSLIPTPKRALITLIPTPPHRSTTNLSPALSPDPMPTTSTTTTHTHTTSALALVTNPPSSSLSNIPTAPPLLPVRTIIPSVSAISSLALNPSLPTTSNLTAGSFSSSFPSTSGSTVSSSKFFHDPNLSIMFSPATPIISLITFLPSATHASFTLSLLPICTSSPPLSPAPVSDPIPSSQATSLTIKSVPTSSPILSHSSTLIPSPTLSSPTSSCTPSLALSPNSDHTAPQVTNDITKTTNVLTTTTTTTSVLTTATTTTCGLITSNSGLPATTTTTTTTTNIGLPPCTTVTGLSNTTTGLPKTAIGLLAMNNNNGFETTTMRELTSHRSTHVLPFMQVSTKKERERVCKMRRVASRI
ncbi:hypothetical protein Pcinc_011638 [Petrolisthes cinctipes]|uniref:Uncharacterized protein n=1 Tax=Petrolisthes cinctipes TaxID=88211 RepID=A0AAE1G390_PETCI|nr:hypothetical protein Pcinc_011638 [Petrolisthes cinctipes]